MKVAFLGNCQAQSLQQWANNDAPQLRVQMLPAVWLIKQESEGEFLSTLDACDFIFSQRVVHGATFVQTKFLKERYGSRVVSWPNAYFDGYFPGLRYVYNASGKVVGPLADYHFDFVIQNYRNGVEASACSKLISTGQILEIYPNPVEKSLGQLRDREQDLDVNISDFIAKEYAVRRLFFSMNHPTDPLLRELMVSILRAVGLDKALEKHSPFPYTLNGIILPFFAAIKARFQMYDDVGLDRFKGVPLSFAPGKTYSVLEGIELYDDLQLVEAFYRCYDNIQNFSQANAVIGD